MRPPEEVIDDIRSSILIRPAVIIETDRRIVWETAIREVAKLCWAVDKSTHPSDLAVIIEALIEKGPPS